MPQTSDKKPEFPFEVPSYEDWAQVAREELNGADPLEKLSIRKGDLEILPFYSAPQQALGGNHTLRPSANSHYGARSWANVPRILVTDEKKANQEALTYLNAGAEGILFDFQSSEINPVILLDKIMLTDCSISFIAGKSLSQWVQHFASYAESNFNVNEVKGSIFWRTDSGNHADIIRSFQQWPHYYSLGMIVQPHTDVTDEIAQALHKVVALTNTLFAEKVLPETTLNQISFSVSVGTDFFLEIAKIKSLRNLWRQIRGAYGLKNDQHLHIHAHSLPWVNDAFQPHGNMIKSTTAAMAAIAGGCDSLTVEPEDNTSNSTSRIARNVSSILREESHFSKVADPTAGSYYLESLTDQLSEKAWLKFQSLTK